MRDVQVRRALAALLAALLAAFGGTAARAADDPAAAAQQALGWLTTRQAADGSFPGFDAGASADAVFAIVAAGADPNSVRNGGNSPLDYLGAQASSYTAKGPAAAGKLTLAVVAAGQDPRNFGGQNLIGLVNQSYNRSTGQFGPDPTSHAYALLALASASQPIPSAAVDALGKSQLPDGGWSYDGTAATGSDTNTTALAVQALAAAKAPGNAQSRALAYLATQQNADGGFPYSKTSSFGSDSDANSTAAVIQALVAAGQDPRAMQQGGQNPVTALLSLQNQNGAFRYQAAAPEDNDLATAQAIPALLLKPQPLRTASEPAATTAPAALPSTGGALQPAWLVAAALTLLVAGLVLRRRVA